MLTLLSVHYVCTNCMHKVCICILGAHYFRLHSDQCLKCAHSLHGHSLALIHVRVADPGRRRHGSRAQSRRDACGRAAAEDSEGLGGQGLQRHESDADGNLKVLARAAGLPDRPAPCPLPLPAGRPCVPSRTSLHFNSERFVSERFVTFFFAQRHKQSRTKLCGYSYEAVSTQDCHQTVYVFAFLYCVPNSARILVLKLRVRTRTKLSLSAYEAITFKRLRIFVGY